MADNKIDFYDLYKRIWMNNQGVDVPRFNFLETDTGGGTEYPSWVNLNPSVPTNTAAGALGASNTSAGTSTTTGGTVTPAATNLSWDLDYNLANAPSWWKGMMPSQWTPESEFAAMTNALMPYMTIEDQRQLGSHLSRLFPDAFGAYSPEQTKFGSPRAYLYPEQKYYFLSQDRGRDMLGALTKMQQATGKGEADMGPGYQYLRHLAQTLVQYGNRPGDTKGMSRIQQKQFYSAIDPLLAEAQGEQLGAYGELARSITQPFFSAGSLVNVGKTDNGEWVFGKANTKWY